MKRRQFRISMILPLIAINLLVSCGYSGIDLQWAADSNSISLRRETGVLEQQNTTKYFFDRAIESWANGETDEAIQFLTDCIELDSKFVRGYLFRAGLRSGNYQIQQAIVDYNTALNLATEPQEKGIILTGRGGLFSKIKEWDKAIRDFDAAIAQGIQNELPTIYASRSSAYFNKKEYAMAEGDATKAIALECNNASWRALRGKIRKDLGDLAGAAADNLESETLRKAKNQEPPSNASE